MIHTPRRRVAAAALTAGALAVPLSMPAFADEKSGPYRVETLSKKYVLPAQIAVDKKIWVTDGEKNTLTVLGRRTPLRYGIKGGDTAGVDQKKNGESLAWATTDGDQKRSHLVIERKGKDTVIAKLGRYEKRKNPDAGNQYGFTAPGPDCTKEWGALKDVPPISYKGVVDTHAYAVAAGRHGSWYVADAAANAILKVDRYGKISTVAVLPPQPRKFTKEDAKGYGLKADSKCVDKDYNFEPVPTDVEVGHRGTLYVSTLAGGPHEPAGAGAPGSVYTINPWKGDVKLLATGFAGATNVAVSPHGSVYVAEFFAGQISKISNGKHRPVVKLAGVLALEHANNHLYASTAQSPDKKKPGKIVKLHYKH